MPPALVIESCALGWEGSRSVKTWKFWLEGREISPQMQRKHEEEKGGPLSP